VFLDRDGTLNETRVEDGVPRPPTSVEALAILPGVPEALQQLRAAGLALIVVTNQPDVARGTLRREAVEVMHRALRERLPLDEIACCYHDDADDCACRKPRPGMLIDSAKRHGVDLPLSFVVGDRWRDIEAGRRAGCTTVLLGRSYSERERAEPDFEAADLSAASQLILGCLEGRRR
jgi:D-glycero-D-manno-heptose 1,7-bisphosphate phosphatase